LRDEALMRLAGCEAHQVRHGVCQRGAAPRQGPRTREPLCSDALADNMVKLNGRNLEAWFNSIIRALAKARIFGKKVTGIVAAIDLGSVPFSMKAGGDRLHRKSPHHSASASPFPSAMILRWDPCNHNLA
jgi:hypothetical protein